MPRSAALALVLRSAASGMSRVVFIRPMYGAGPFFTSTLSSRRSKSTRTARRLAQICLLPLDRLIARDHHLRNAVSRVDLVILPAEVKQNHPDLAAISRIDGSRRVRHRDAVLQSQAAARPDLRFIAGRQFDGETGCDGQRNPWRECRAFHGAKIHAGVFSRAMRVFGEDSVVGYPA